MSRGRSFVRQCGRSTLSQVVFAAAVQLLACGDDPSSTDDGAEHCVELDIENCQMLYPPEWDQVYAQTLAPSCAQSSACHVDAAAAGASGGLFFDDVEASYQRLTNGSEPFVRAGDPHCSPLVLRLESTDPARRMPPGTTPLAASARCSIARWIANGATR